ncbi:MAG TPA: HypC/HybG/HupF family hydrogenase formation chaperone [Nakamurella sp.]|nr:HypC/HybG/HupF family hydrogenase formation chaperone [Nakamurella sp.]
MAPHGVLAVVTSLGGALPPTLVVGCEPAELEDRIGLSTAVAAAVEPTIEAVLGLLSELPAPAGRRWTMCLGIPGRVVEMVDGYADQIALVDVVGKVRPINVGMLQDPVSPGDRVIIPLGFAVEVVDQDRAERALSALELMGRARDEHGIPGP